MGDMRDWLAIRVDPLARGSAEKVELSSQIDSREFGCNDRAVDYWVRIRILISTEYGSH